MRRSQLTRGGSTFTKLAATDPGIAKWQVGVCLSLWSLADLGFEPIASLERIVETLTPLEQEGRLTAHQKSFFAQVRRRLALQQALQQAAR